MAHSVDQLLADEQYAIGSGPAVNTTAASTTAGNTSWALTDHLGSVRDLVDNNGVIREHNVYDSFGRLVREVDYNAAGQPIASTSAAAVDTLFGYTGRLFDSHTGLQYNRARWYDPATGRWLSQDPIGFAAGDANLYRYVGNGPTNATDPSGRFRTNVHIDITLEAFRKLGYNVDNSRMVHSIVGANMQVDFSEKLFKGDYHASEIGYLKRFQTLNSKIDELLCQEHLDATELIDLWTLIGEAMHLLQDFFSHTDWIDGRNLRKYYLSELRNEDRNFVMGLAEGSEKHEPHSIPPSISDFLSGSYELEHVHYFSGGYWPFHRFSFHNKFAADNEGLGRDVWPHLNAFKEAKRQATEATEAYIRHLRETKDCHGHLSKSHE